MTMALRFDSPGESHLLHLNFTTNSITPSFCARPDEAATGVLLPFIQQSLVLGLAVPVFGLGSDVWMRVSQETRTSYVVEILGDTVNRRIPIATFGVALDADDGRELWRRLTSELVGATSLPTEPPPMPWIGVRLEEGAARWPAMTRLGGSFERCVAWTLARRLSSGPLASIAPKAEAPVACAQASSPIAPVLAEDGCVFDFNSLKGPTLDLYFEHPTEAEIANVRRGDAKFALVKHGCALFLLSKFGESEWMDSPYSIGLHPAELRGLPEGWRPGARLALMVRIIDRRTGEQRGGRFVTWSPSFSEAFVSQVLRQAKLPTDRSTHDRVVDAAYHRHPTSRGMLKSALARCNGGD